MSIVELEKASKIELFTLGLGTHSMTLGFETTSITLRGVWSVRISRWRMSGVGGVHGFRTLRFEVVPRLAPGLQALTEV